MGAAGQGALSEPDIIVAEDSAALGQEIESKLLAALRRDLPQSANTSFVLSARDRDGTLHGGLTASASYGWLAVKTIWVDAAARGRGIGRALMAHAEERARAIGCHGAWLDTSNPDAMRFYARLGYAAFGELANSPAHAVPTHRRWFMRKHL